MRGQSLRDLVESNGIPWVQQKLNECMALYRREPNHEDGLRPEDFSIRELAEAFCGEDWVRRLNPQNFRTGMAILEGAGDAVDVTAFANITGQIFYNKILDGWQTAKAIGDELVETIQTDLDGEKIPWISPPLMEEGKVHPGLPYQESGLVEEYIETPSLDTYGRILSIHKLTIFYDRTAMVMRQANTIGERLKKSWNRRVLNTFLGASGTPAFKWRGVSYTPYQSNGTYWTNDFSGQPLVDWTSIEKVEIAATKILEPDLQNAGINEPIDIALDTIIVMPSKKHTARRILTATDTRSNNLQPAPNQATYAPSPLDSYKTIDDKQLYRQAIDQLGLTTAQAEDLWFMMDSKKKPIAYMQNWALTIEIAPPNSPAMFERDIVFRIKGSERGTTAWLDPRYVFRMRNT